MTDWRLAVLAAACGACLAVGLSAGWISDRSAGAQHGQDIAAVRACIHNPAYTRALLAQCVDDKEGR